jgi:ribosomal protein L40E
MIRCKKCGTLNEAEATFCSQCDAFLEWSGELLDETGEPVSASGPSDQHAPGDEPLPRPAGAQPAPTQPRAPAPTHRGTSRATRDVGGAEPTSRRPEKGAVTPERRAKPQQPTKVEKPKPGQRVCPTCGTGNDPDRKFCRRCGNEIGVAPVEPTPTPEPTRRRGSSWLSGVLRRGRQEAYMAGQRPESMLSSRGRWRPGSSMMVFGLLGVLGLGSVASYLYVPGVSDTVDQVVRTIQNRIGERQPVNITGVQAHSTPGYPALNMIDGGSNTWWAGPVSQNGRWQLDFELQERSDLLQINFDSGADGESFDQLGRPHEILVRADGELSPRYELKDTAEQQVVEVDIQDVEELRIIVLSRYEGLASGDEIAIREVSFIGPRG